MKTEKIEYLQVVGPHRCVMPKPETGLKWYEERTKEQECGMEFATEEEFDDHAVKVHGMPRPGGMWEISLDGPREPQTP